MKTQGSKFMAVYSNMVYDTDLQGFVAAVVYNAVWINVLMFFSPTFLQEICVSNHTQKQQNRQTIHKDSISHQVLQVHVFFFNYDLTVYL